MVARKTIPFNFGDKHKAYIRACADNTFNFAEGAVRAGKTVDNVFAFAHELKTTPDKIHLASGSTIANAKLNIGDANGFGLEAIFRGQCRWGKYKDNECLYIKGPATGGRQRIVIFAGGAKADSFKKIRGNSYGMWIATEINLHHDTMIKEVFNRQLAAKRRKIFWDLNPDNPNAPIYTEYIDKYRDLAAAGTLLGGYHYEHFTIFDNINIPTERQQEIISQYDPQTVWYRRDILGQRCVAEGLVYPLFADQPERFILAACPPVQYAVIGVDFGGSKSAHSFTLTGFTQGFKQVVILDEYYHNNDKDGRLSPAQVEAAFVDFVKRAKQQYKVYEAYCDSAEQTLIEGLRVAAAKNHLGIEVKNAQKGPINDRIAFYCSLMAQERFKVMPHCKATIEALTYAVYSGKDPTQDERLDDGTTNIDSLDSLEYTTEHLQADIMYLR